MFKVPYIFTAEKKFPDIILRIKNGKKSLLVHDNVCLYLFLALLYYTNFIYRPKKYSLFNSDKYHNGLCATEALNN